MSILEKTTELEIQEERLYRKRITIESDRLKKHKKFML